MRVRVPDARERSSPVPPGKVNLVSSRGTEYSVDLAVLLSHDSKLKTMLDEGVEKWEIPYGISGLAD